MAFVTEDNITDLAVAQWASAHSPRTAEIMAALIRHIHDYAREVNLTSEEWMAAIDWLTEVGRISTDNRREFILASDVVGLSTLVVQMNNRLPAPATPATVLGPFHIDGSPPASFGFDMSDGVEGTPLFITGTITDTAGTPIADATLDVWQADATGTYEAQYTEVDEARLRAKYSTRSDGTYCVRTIAPIGYTIPMDGPVGKLVSATDISEYRPAHIHFMFEEPGYHKLITHLFRHGSDHLDTDVVFGVKDELVVSFIEHPAGPGPDGRQVDEPFLVAHYDFVLQALSSGHPG